MFEGGANAMSLADSQPDAWLARRCSVEVVRRASASAPECDDGGTNDDEQSQYSRPAEWLGRLAHQCIIQSTKRGCAQQCFHVRGPFGPLTLCTLLVQCGSDGCPRRGICNCGWPFCGRFLPVGDVFALLLLHCWDGWWQHDLFRAGGVGPRRLVFYFASHDCSWACSRLAA